MSKRIKKSVQELTAVGIVASVASIVSANPPILHRDLDSFPPATEPNHINQVSFQETVEPPMIQQLPIPELPKNVTPINQKFDSEKPKLPDPVPAPIGILPSELPIPSQITSIPEPKTSQQPFQSVLTLHPAQLGNNLNSESGSNTGREILPLPKEKFVSTINNTNTISQPEDPMFKQSIFAATISAALATNPALADETKTPAISGQTPDKKEIVEAPKPLSNDVKLELETVKSMLEALTAKQKQLGDAVLGKNEGRDQDAGLNKKVDELTASLKLLESSVKKLDEKVSKLNENVEKVRSGSLTEKSSEKSTSEKRDIDKSESKMGVIKLINQYQEKVTVIVNGKAHRLDVGETKDVLVPSGKFDYALPLSGGELKSSEVKEKEIVNLKIK